MNQKKLLVFVSSTYNDLKEERQAAVQAILKAGHIPAGMELFTSGDKSQLQTINDWIDESDVYMLILGGRYGSLEPTSNVSYTELEYDYAKSTGKPCFAVVISDDALDKKVKEFGKYVIEQDNSTQLKQFRAKVLSSICSFFDELKDVKLCVYESLGGYARDPNLSGWVSGKNIPDNSSILRELEELRTENAELRKSIILKNKQSPANDVSHFEDLENILEATIVKIPSDAHGEADIGDVDINLNIILTKNSGSFATGVTNRVGTSASENFLYFNVAPKLQIHGLVANEKVPGVQFRRYYLTKDGERYLSWFTKKEIEKSVKT